VSATVIPRDITVTAQALMAGDKGLLAIDESTGTCNARFAAAPASRSGVPR
jgi:fructose-bisphosphate aldolase class 1